MNQRKTSARFYLFESLLEETKGFAHLKKRRSIADLQLLAGIVWACEKGKRRAPCPIIRPQPKGLNKEKDTSYYCDGVIGLLPKHRNISTLLHEMAHALGTKDKLTHGPAFRDRVTYLYKFYGEWDGVVSW